MHVLQTYTLFDFLPVNATSPTTAACLLAGGKWPGQKRERQLKRRPAYRHQTLIGEAIVPQVYCGHLSQTSPQGVQYIITPMSRGTPHGLFLWILSKQHCSNSPMLAWATAKHACCRQYWRCSVRLAATCAEILVGPTMVWICRLLMLQGDSMRLGTQTSSCSGMTAITTLQHWWRA